MKIAQFQKKIWDYYRTHGRHNLPWRKTRDPYKILVSEVMLQQTQVSRVIPKYEAFIKRFPTVEKLARASTQSVLALWSGLGYNRRALYLKRVAEIIVREYKGTFPRDVALLEKLPGIGPYTARAVATFAWGEQYVFIETNIRSVFIHEYFHTKTKVDDKDILVAIGKTLPRNKEKSRDWYYALMDYGAMLKTTVPNPNRKSAHHTKQSKFEGSDRQVRGAIVRLIIKNKHVTEKAAVRLLAMYPKQNVCAQFRKLKKEGF